MRKVRLGMFETNSSSVHSLVICTKEDYEKFEKGELNLLVYGDQLTEEAPDDEDILSAEQYYEWVKNRYFDTYEQSFTTPSGDEIVAFGHLGGDC